MTVRDLIDKLREHGLDLPVVVETPLPPEVEDAGATHEIEEAEEVSEVEVHLGGLPCVGVKIR